MWVAGLVALLLIMLVVAVGTELRRRRRPAGPDIHGPRALLILGVLGVGAAIPLAVVVILVFFARAA